MANNEGEKEKYQWKKLLRKNRKAFSAFIVAMILAFIGFILVMVWYIETSPLGGQGSWTFDQWTLNYVIGFLIQSILWELLFVGIPLIAFLGIFGYLWWTNLSDETKEEFKSLDADKKLKKGKKSQNKKYQGSGGFSFFIFIVVCILVAIDGNWNTRFGLLEYSYFLYAYLFAMMWIGIIIGIPMVIAVVIYYLTRKKEKG